MQATAIDTDKRAIVMLVKLDKVGGFSLSTVKTTFSEVPMLPAASQA
jgi:hypothetical protein